MLIDTYLYIYIYIYIYMYIYVCVCRIYRLRVQGWKSDPEGSERAAAGHSRSAVFGRTMFDRTWGRSRALKAGVQGFRALTV